MADRVKYDHKYLTLIIYIKVGEYFIKKFIFGQLYLDKNLAYFSHFRATILAKCLLESL